MAYVDETFLPCDAGDTRLFVKWELDTETGLYYYGARYLDPKYSRWLSGDPAIGEYIPIAGEDNSKLPAGGIFNLMSFSLFNYAKAGGGILGSAAVSFESRTGKPGDRVDFVIAGSINLIP